MNEGEWRDADKGEKIGAAFFESVEWLLQQAFLNIMNSRLAEIPTTSGSGKIDQVRQSQPFARHLGMG
jgi:hypothetical protein